MGAQRVQMKGVLPWLDSLGYRRAFTRDFGPALAALVGKVQNIFSSPYTISIHLSPSPSKLDTGQTVVLGRLSLSTYLWSSPPNPYVVVTCEEWCCYSRRGWFVLAPIRTRAQSHEENCISFGKISSNVSLLSSHYESKCHTPKMQHFVHLLLQQKYLFS
jgi:hypothetical protein